MTKIDMKAFAQKPIAFYRIYARIAKSANAGLMLSQCVFWSNIKEKEDGWFYKTVEEWNEETELTRSEQETARKKLIALGVIECKLKGIPATLYYRVNFDKLAEVIESRLQETCNPVKAKPANLMGQNLQTSLQETSKQDVAKPANINKDTETTQRIPENTTDIVAASQFSDDCPEGKYHEFEQVYIQETKAPLFHGGVQPWFDALEKIAGLGVTPEEFREVIQIVLQKGYNFSGPKSFINATINYVAHRGKEIAKPEFNQDENGGFYV